MKNIDIKTKGTQLTIIIDLAQQGDLSKSGKMRLISSTGGWQVVNGAKAVNDEDIRINLTAGYYAQPK